MKSVPVNAAAEIMRLIMYDSFINARVTYF